LFVTREHGDAGDAGGPGLSLRELGGVLWRERWILASATVLAMVVAAAATWWMPRVYGGDALIDIGDLAPESAQQGIDRARVLAVGWGVSTAYRAPAAYYVGLEANAPAEVGTRLEQFTANAVSELSNILNLSIRQDATRLEELERRHARMLQDAGAWIAQLDDELRDLADVNNRAQRDARQAQGQLQSDRTRLIARLRARLGSSLRSAEQRRTRASQKIERLRRVIAAGEERERELAQLVTRIESQLADKAGSINDSSGTALILQMRRELADMLAERRTLRAELTGDVSVSLDDATGALEDATRDVSAASAALDVLRGFESSTAAMQPQAADVLIAADVPLEDVRPLEQGIAEQDALLRRRLRDLEDQAAKLRTMRQQMVREPDSVARRAAVQVAFGLARVEGPPGRAPRATDRLDWVVALDTKLGELDGEVKTLRNRLEHLRKPRVASGPTVFANPVRPRPSWNLALSAVLGFASAAFFVLVWRRSAPASYVPTF
jgi:LPS O-antigen subunit length determinant protein (WzzB/FepE family)